METPEIKLAYVLLDRYGPVTWTSARDEAVTRAYKLSEVKPWEPIEQISLTWVKVNPEDPDDFVAYESKEKALASLKN